jgi:hypothetical protein
LERLPRGIADRDAIVRVFYLARGPALKNLSRPKVEWGLIWSLRIDARKFVRMERL